MKLAIVTHTAPTGHKRWLSQCINSVENNSLPLGCIHHIIECSSAVELEQARWEALKLAEYVCFVDDDDMVLNESIKICLSALEARPDIGVAFTDEQYINDAGDQISSIHSDIRKLRYCDIAQSAQTIHHLALIRTSKVDWKAKALSDKYGSYADWAIKAGSALANGCVHVPIKGYAWRQRDNQMSKAKTWNIKFDTSLHVMRAYFMAQVGCREYIEQID